MIDKTKKDKYRELQRINFTKYENILDDCKYGHKRLEDKKIANVVKDSLRHRNGDIFDLIAYTIMPNHIYLIIYPIVERKASFAQIKNENINSDSGESLYISKTYLLFSVPK